MFHDILDDSSVELPGYLYYRYPPRAYHLTSFLDMILLETGEYVGHEQELAFWQWLEHNVGFPQHDSVPSAHEQQLAI